MLSEYTSTNITLLPGQKYKYRNEIRTLQDTSALLSALLSYDVIFVRFDFDFDFDFGSYVTFLEKRRELMLSARKEGARSGGFIEISYGLEKQLEKWNLHLLKPN